ncbi:mechanosensitive ion channel [Massilia terrae]|uniref:Mechanosensitive ion channel n=1 Tax=Massilia terrae TaxID=1811224 RepID=A0ABT2CWB1_9BURK|nr:mechanosensitive ion channel domain-containing protein [Massilia terrae]MCS0658239.1 mechanosensitive ion channel [Massilia terrae]
MVVSSPLSSLLPDLLEDLSRPGIKWQAVAVFTCAALGWLLARIIRKMMSARGDGERGFVRLGAQSFLAVLDPLMVVALLYGAKRILVWQHLHINLVRVAIPIFLSLAVIRCVFYLLRRVFARTGELGAHFVLFEKVFALVAWLGAALYISGMWDDLYDYLNVLYIPIGKNQRDWPSVIAFLRGGVSVVVLVMLAMWIGAALQERIMGMASVNTSLRVMLARLSKALLIIVVVLMCLQSMGLDLTVLSVFGGAFGVGLGLGMQRIASNYVSGFVILLERSLSIGDMISLDKYTGKVTNINTRYTVLQGLDGVETVLPNEMLISVPVQNQSLSSRRVRGSTKLIVAHGSDLNAVMPMLLALAKETPRVLADPAPGVGLSRIAPEGYELDVGFWVGDPENGLGGVAADLNKRIYGLVQSGQIKLATTGLDVRVTDVTPPTNVSPDAQTKPA